MFCTNCGSKLSDTAKFCSNCGAPRYVYPVAPVGNKIDFSTFKKSDYQYDYSHYGNIKINDGGVIKEISVELSPDDDEKIADSSKEALQFFVDNYDKYREIYQHALYEYYQELRSTLGYDNIEAAEEDSFPYVTTFEEFLETVEFTGMIVHDDKKDGKHAIGLYFDATWEEEHGAGVLMAGFEVLDTGNFDHAHYTYALSKNRDN